MICTVIMPVDNDLTERETVARSTAIIRAHGPFVIIGVEKDLTPALK